ncbi:hypothetical protein FYB92_08335 [Novacetimonas sp. GS1]
MFVSGNTSPCHHSLHLFAKTDESQHAGIVQKLSDQALRLLPCLPICGYRTEDDIVAHDDCTGECFVYCADRPPCSAGIAPSPSRAHNQRPSITPPCPVSVSSYILPSASVRYAPSEMERIYPFPISSA